MPADAPDDPVQLPAPGGRVLRRAVGAVVVLAGLMQVAVGIQVSRIGPAIGGAVLLVLGAVLVLGAGRGTAVGRGGIHAPNRLRERQLPWSTIDALHTRRATGGRVELLVQREGYPAEAAVRVAALRSADAARLLPAIAAHAAANDVPLHDGT